MVLTDLKPVQVETGIIFGQECYLDPARAREFLAQVNAIFPNFLTRYDYQQLPNRFVLENSNGTRRCIVELNRFVYSVQGSAEPNNFLHEVENIFDHFRYLFALEDVRRIGKIYHLQFPDRLSKKSLSNILRIEEPVQVDGMQLLFREEEKNINIHLGSVETGIIELASRTVDLTSEVMIRCDINNINTSLGLKIPGDLKEIFKFADRYVQTDLVNFLSKYFGGTP